MHRKKSMSHKKLTIVSLAAVPLVAGLGFAVTQAAFAGTNGQQIALCQPKTDYRSAIVQNEDQSEEPTTYPLSDQMCNVVKDALWKGQVQITWRGSASLPDATSVCIVPEGSAEETVICKPDDFLDKR